MEITAANLKALAVPLLLLAGALLISVLGGRVIWGRLARLRQELELAKKNEQVLAAKVDLLQSLSSSLGSQSSGLALALPEENSSVTAISQIRVLANESGLVLSNLLAGSEISSGKTDLARTEIKFEVEGARPVVSSFLRQVYQTLPITSLENVEINETSDFTRVTVTLSAYWSGYPDKLPAVAEPLEPLSTEEQNLVSEVLTRRAPSFVNLSPSAPQTRANPFAL